MSTADTPDLEALFDSILAQADAPSAAATAPAATAPAVAPAELAPAAAPHAPAASTDSDGTVVYDKVGKLVRQLHNTLTELGYTQILEQAMHTIPDTRDRLSYISNLTEQAACRVLNATDSASPLQDSLASDVRELGEGWQRLFNHQMDIPEFRELAFRSRDFFTRDAPPRIQQTQSDLTEIMMAQDFQDLTGQVIKKVIGMAQELEKGLLQILVEVIPEASKKEEASSLINGPVISAEGRSDVVASQQQVDDLLDSLGF